MGTKVGKMNEWVCVVKHIMQYKITDTIQELLDWFAENTILIGEYLLPIVSRKYEGEQLYNHIQAMCLMKRQKFCEVMIQNNLF